MRLAKIQLARSIWLFDTAELNPFGASIFPTLLVKIAERYHFRKFPKPEEAQVGTSIRFDYGQFVNDGTVYEVGLELFADGITGDTRHSTGISDLFLFDLAHWLAQEFGFLVTNKLTSKRAYRSEIILYADRGLAGLCEKFDQLSSMIGDIAGTSTELTALTFGIENKLSLFSFERKINEPLEDLKFYSAAMMETSAHIKALDALAGIIPGESLLFGTPATRPPVEAEPDSSQGSV